MRVVAVGGQWIELQCPLVSELLAAGSQTAERAHAIQWRKSKYTCLWFVLRELLRPGVAVKLT